MAKPLTKEEIQMARDTYMVEYETDRWLDTIEALESEKALERANERDLILQEISSVKSIIPEIAHALVKLLAKATLGEAEWWNRMVDNELAEDRCRERLAILRAACQPSAEAGKAK